MLARQADSLAASGYDVATYDRRGTRRSGRQDWPGGGANQHADDAAALIRALGWKAPTVVGVSSGGVIALTLAVRHPGSVGSIVAWEPPAVGIIQGGMEATTAIMAPVDAHLASHPGDFAGAQALLLSTVLGFPVSVDDPAFAPARINAEPFVRDEPAITTASFDRAGLASAHVTIAVGSAPNDIIARRGRRPLRLDRPAARPRRRRPRGVPHRTGRADGPRHDARSVRKGAVSPGQPRANNGSR